MIQSAQTKIEAFRLDDFRIDGADFALLNSSTKVSFVPPLAIADMPDMHINYQAKAAQSSSISQLSSSQSSSAELEWFSDLLDRAASFGYKEV